MTTNKNYNTDLWLWQNQFKVDSSKPNGGATLQLHNGMIGNGYNVLARFAGDKEARETLISAGYSEVKPNMFRTDKDQWASMNSVEKDHYVGIIPEK